MIDALERVAELIERESGIQARSSQLEALAAAIERAAPGMDADAFIAALADPAQHSALLGRLIDQVAIQETYFMRDPRELEAIDWHQLLAAAHSRGASEVKVWVCACASGEEAYSVAILAIEAFGHGRPPVSILATDISTRALRRADEAAYSDRSIRDLSPSRRDRFLVRKGARSMVGEQLRSLVHPRRHNLVADPAPPVGEVPFDLVLCRNVLIYFGPETVEAAISSLESALQPGGQLILGASDRLASSARRLSELAGDRAERVASGRPPAPVRRPAGRPAGTLRKPLGKTGGSRGSVTANPPAPDLEMAEAVEAANRGQFTAAIEAASRVLAADPLVAEAYYVRGLSELASGDPAAAIGSLRRALYVDPSFALAAFQLARAYDRRGDTQPARKAYAWALRALDQNQESPRGAIERADLADIALACRARLAEAAGSR